MTKAQLISKAKKIVKGFNTELSCVSEQQGFKTRHSSSYIRFYLHAVDKGICATGDSPEDVLREFAEKLGALDESKSI